MGTPNLHLDVTDVFTREGLDNGLKFYGDVDYVFQVSESAILQIYGQANPDLDSQLANIQKGMSIGSPIPRAPI